MHAHAGLVTHKAYHPPRSPTQPLTRPSDHELELACVKPSVKSTVNFTRNSALNFTVNFVGNAGGVSMGDRDLIKPLLERHGVVHFGRVLMKPGACACV